MALTLVGVLALAYGVFVAIKLGLHQRLPLAFGPISLEDIPDRAAKKYREKVLFTSDAPCGWEVPALRDRYRTPTEWSALRIRSTAGFLATMFRDRLGIARGDRIAVLKSNHFDIHVLVVAIVRAGGIACPINGRFAAAHLHAYLLHIGARILISDSATLLRILRDAGDFGTVDRIIVAERKAAALHHLEMQRLLAASRPDVELIWVEDALQDVREESGPVRRGQHEPLYLVHSSGTTGFPKAVVLKNGAQSHAVRGWLRYVHVSRDHDKGYLAVPNNHQAVILSFNSLLLLGLRTHWAAAYDREDFQAESVIRQLADGRFTGFFGFPITYTQLKEVRLENHDLSRMWFWASTADASHEAIQRRFVSVGSAFRRLGLPFRGSVYLDAQGSSEVGTPSVIRYVTTFTRKFARRIGRPGSTPFGPRIRVTGNDGAIARRGEAGRLEVRGRTVFDAYWNNQALTSAVIRDGWFFTGDMVRSANDGHLVQLDREVDVIHTSAGAVYSLLIEETVHKHPAVFDACVYGARQPDGTQLPAAAIALRTGYEIGTEQLRTELNSMLTDVQQIHRLDILSWDQFPIGITGKTLKRVFRERTEPMALPVAVQ